SHRVERVALRRTASGDSPVAEVAQAGHDPLEAPLGQPDSPLGDELDLLARLLLDAVVDEVVERPPRPACHAKSGHDGGEISDFWQHARLSGRPTLSDYR